MRVRTEAQREQHAREERERYHRTRHIHGRQRQEDVFRVPPEHRPARAAWRRATWAWGETVAWDVWLRVYFGNCFRCGKVANGVDHILTRAQGGRNVAENLQPACLKCNQIKGPRWNS